jgi:hypothetical protein
MGFEQRRESELEVKSAEVALQRLVEEYSNIEQSYKVKSANLTLNKVTTEQTDAIDYLEAQLIMVDAKVKIAYKAWQNALTRQFAETKSCNDKLLTLVPSLRYHDQQPFDSTKVDGISPADHDTVGRRACPCTDEAASSSKGVSNRRFAKRHRQGAEAPPRQQTGRQDGVCAKRRKVSVPREMGKLAHLVVPRRVIRRECQGKARTAAGVPAFQQTPKKKLTVPGQISEFRQGHISTMNHQAASGKHTVSNATKAARQPQFKEFVPRVPCQHGFVV